MLKLHRKTIVAIALNLYWAFAGIVAIEYRINYLQMTLLFLAVPAGLLLILNKGFRIKTIIEAVSYSVPVVFVLNFIATYSKAWTEQTSFNFKVLGVVPLETFLWGFFYMMLIIGWYDYLFDNKKLKKLPTRFTREIWLAVIMVTSFLVVLFLDINALKIGNFYLYLSAIFITTTVLGLIKYPKLYAKATLTGISLLFFSIYHELISISLGHWSFEGENYIGFISISGVIFPLEELIWLIIVAPFVVILHEYFADNLK